MAALQSVVCAVVSDLLVSPIPPRPHCFQLALTVFLAAPSPVTYVPGSSSRVLASSSEYVPACNLPCNRSCSAPSLGLVPSSRHQRGASTCDEPSTARLRSVLNVSHTLDGFLRPCTWWPYFMPHATCKVHFPRAFPGAQQRWLIASLALLTFRIRPLCREVAPAAPGPKARPSERCSRHQSVNTDRGIRSVLASIPS